MSTKINPVNLPTVRFNQTKGLSEAECIKRDLPSTSKSKWRLGINDDRKICWSPANFSLTDHRLLESYATIMGYQADELLAAVAMQWFLDNRATIELEVASYQSGDKSEAQLERQLELELARIEATKALLASKRQTPPAADPKK